MCKYSLEGYLTRRAVKGETLVANMHSARNHGVLTKPNTRFDGTLTCVRDGTKLTIEKLEIKSGMTASILKKYNFDDAMQYVGKRVVCELVDGRGVPNGMDSLRFGNMRWGFPLAWLEPGTVVYVGVKKETTLEEKLELDAKSLRRVAADMALIDPNPKPDDEEEKDKEEEAEEKKEITREATRLEHLPVATPPTVRVRRRVPIFRSDD